MRITLAAAIIAMKTGARNCDRNSHTTLIDNYKNNPLNISSPNLGYLQVGPAIASFRLCRALRPLTMSNLTTSTSGNQTLILDPNLCTLQTCNLSLASFSYIPNLAGNALYLAIFAILFFVQLGLGIRYRIWGFMGAMLLGLVCSLLTSLRHFKKVD